MTRREGASVVVVAVLCVGLGFALGVRRQNGSPLDAGSLGQTFSRAGNAMLVLQQERRLFTDDWAVRYLAARTAAGEGTRLMEDPAIRKLINELEAETAKYAGTAEEAVLRHYWMSAIGGLGRRGEWLDAYLRLIYEQPGDESVTRWAARAVEFAKALNRLEELRAAFQHWREIPAGFAGKSADSDLLVGVGADARWDLTRST